MGQVHIVRQGAGEVSQQRVKRPEPVCGDGINYPVEIPVSVAVETDFFSLLLRGKGLQGTGPVKAAVSAVCWTQYPVHPSAAAGMPLGFVPIVEMFQLHVSIEGHEHSSAIWKGNPQETQKLVTNTIYEP